FFGINITSSQFSVVSSAVRYSPNSPSRFEKRRANCEKRYLKRSRLHTLRLAFALTQDFALVHPALHADDAVRGVRLGKAVINVSAQSVQRQTSLQIPLGARDFVSVEAAADPHLDALASETQRRVHGLAHGATEADTLFQLQSDVLRHQLRVQFRLVHLEN